MSWIPSQSSEAHDQLINILFKTFWDHFIYKTIVLREEGTNFLKCQHSSVSLSDFFLYNHDLLQTTLMDAKEKHAHIFPFSMPKEKHDTFIYIHKISSKGVTRKGLIGEI